ncbi:Crp/Fnr family transcriptional regulator [Sphingobacterium deserti]|nr:Crp/Fnr family transcriptional regulator [Sphingobacterium deserti]
MKLTKPSTCDHSCFMCQHVVQEWRSHINDNKQLIKLKRGERFIEEGSAVRGVYFVQSGLVKVHRRWADKEMIVRFAKKGDIVGHRGVGTAQDGYPISATALEPTLLCFVDITFFMSTLRFNPNLTYQLMLFFADELQVSEQKMGNMLQLPVKNRLAWSLVLLHKIFGIDGEDGYLGLTLSKTDLAAYVGTTYETVYRVLADFVDARLLQLEGKKIFLKDLAALRILALEKE